MLEVSHFSCHFWLDVTKTSKTSITSGFCTDVTLDVHFQGATLSVVHGSLSVAATRATRCMQIALVTDW